MTRLASFLRRPRADRRLLTVAAILHVIVAVAVPFLPFGRVQRLLKVLAGAGRGGTEGVDPRVIRAVHSASARLPGASCLTEALVAQCLLARRRCDTTLRFGVARGGAAGRSFHAHAWLERGCEGVVGAGPVVYEPLLHPRACLPSTSPLQRD